MKKFTLVGLLFTVFASCSRESIYEYNVSCVSENVSTVVIQNNFPRNAMVEYNAGNDSLPLTETTIQIMAGQNVAFKSFSNQNHFRLKMIDSINNSIIYSAKKSIVTEACGIYQLVF